MRLIDTPSCDEPLPDPETLAGAVLMGGPMSANDTDRHPWLAVELDWCSRGLRAGLPLLGVCLGAQLIARALGAEVRPAERKELGWGSLEVLDPSDPLVGALASGVPVLHWHGEIFDLPAAPPRSLVRPTPRVRRSAPVSALGGCCSTPRLTPRSSISGSPSRRWSLRHVRRSARRPSACLGRALRTPPTSCSRARKPCSPRSLSIAPKFGAWDERYGRWCVAPPFEGLRLVVACPQ